MSLRLTLLCSPGAGIRCADGFTLIEVLVALIIVAAGMSALMSALSSSANTVSYMREKTFSEWVALNQVATFRLQLNQGQVPAEGHTNGDTDFAGRSWHWRQDIVKTQVQGMMRVDVKVRPKEAKGGDDDGWYVTVSGLTGDALAGPGTADVGNSSQWDQTSTSNGFNGNNQGNQLPNPNSGATPSTGTNTNGLGSGLNGPGNSGGTTPNSGTAPVPPPNNGSGQ
jgi:general secretion pathway protein I